MQNFSTYSEESQSLSTYLANFFSLSEMDRMRQSANFRARFLDSTKLTTSHDDMSQMRRAWAAESYVHANGFARVVAFVTECGSFRLRVHVWPQGIKVDNLNVHNHRYEFVSFVNKGAVDDVVWRPAESGEIFRRFLYTSRDATGNYRHEYIDEQRICVDSVRRINAGQLYSLCKEKFHYTKPSPLSVTVTFFAEDRRQLLPSAVTYSRHHAIDEENTFTPSLTYGEYQQILQAHASDASVACLSTYDEKL